MSVAYCIVAWQKYKIKTLQLINTLPSSKISLKSDLLRMMAQIKHFHSLLIKLCFLIIYGEKSIFKYQLFYSEVIATFFVEFQRLKYSIFQKFNGKQTHSVMVIPFKMQKKDNSMGSEKKLVSFWKIRLVTFGSISEYA